MDVLVVERREVVGGLEEEGEEKFIRCSRWEELGGGGGEGGGGDRGDGGVSW